MPAFENSITTELIAYIIYTVKPTFYITLLIRIFIYYTVTMFGTGLLQFFLQPFFIHRVHRLISLIANMTQKYSTNIIIWLRKYQNQFIFGKDTKGCFLPGDSYSFDEMTETYNVWNSKKKTKELFDFFDNYGKNEINVPH